MSDGHIGELHDFTAEEIRHSRLVAVCRHPDHQRDRDALRGVLEAVGLLPYARGRAGR